jgi:hypothetical protein
LQALRAGHRFLTQGDIGLHGLLRFRRSALGVALAQSLLIAAERLPPFVPQIILVALSTLGWTLLALHPAQAPTTVLHTAGSSAAMPSPCSCSP